MTKAFLLGIFILIFGSDLNAQFHKVLLDSSEFSKITSLDDYGLTPQDIFRKGDKISIIADSATLDLLKSIGFHYTIEIANFENYLSNRLIKEEFPKVQSEIFKFGSMGGFYTLEELYAEYDSLVAHHPGYAQKEIIGKSHENRDIIAYHFSNFLTASPSKKPEILYTSLHHAREPEGATALVYFIKHLFSGFDSQNPEAEYLINNRHITIVPAVNPDGYYYNQVKYPNGGGLWRKNRLKVNDSTYGVDLNRNYGPDEFWASSAGGSSTNPVLATYRGASAFSEPETKAIKELCEKSKFKICINYHTYGGLLIYPWGVLSQETPDSATFRKLCYYTNSLNKYVYGLDYQTLNYVSQGNADDWMYLETPEKGKILSLTPEVGSEKDYFWPTKDRIEPLAIENLKSNYEFLWSTVYNIKIINFNSDYDSNKKINTLNIEVANIGCELSPKTTFFNIKSLNSKVIVSETENFVSSLKSGESQFFNLKVEFKNGLENGSYVGFETEILQNGVSRKDTFFLRMIMPEVTDLFNGNRDGWNLGSWDLVEDKELGSYVLTDSPGDLYAHNTTNYMQYDNVDLQDCHFAELEFTSKWFIEKDWDAGVIEVQEIGDQEWYELVSSRMVQGLGINKSRQLEGMNLLQGNIFDYCRQTVDLSDYCGKRVNLRFGLLSDNATAYDGWTISNVKLKTYDKYSKVNDFITDKEVSNSYVFNKHSNITICDLEGNEGDTFYLVNTLGKVSEKGRVRAGEISIETTNLPLGCFNLVVEGDTQKSIKILLTD